MIIEQWSATASTGAVAAKQTSRFIGQFPGFVAAKRRANAMAASVRGSTSAAARWPKPRLGPQLPNSAVIFSGPSGSDTSFIPPDSEIAAGPNNLLIAINSLLAIYDKTGVQQGNFQDLQTFFGGLGFTGQIYDSRVLYDQQDDRFILSAAEVDLQGFTNGHVLVAVSQSSDPTGAWYKFAINFMGRDLTNTVNTFPDFPGLGLSVSAIYITSNQFVLNAQCIGPDPNEGCAFSDAWIKVIGLPELLSGNPNLNITSFTDVRTQSSQLAFSIQPALSYGSPSAEFLVAASFDANPGNVLNLFSINLSGAPTVQTEDLSVPPFSLPPDAVQGGTNNLINTDDFRTLNAVWSNGSLWCTQNVAGAGFSDSAARWYQIQLSSLAGAALAQTGDVSGSGAAYYPAISQRADGLVGMVFTTSSATVPASAAFTARVLSDTAGTMEGYVIYQPGLGPYDDDRWGDYSGISLNPDGNSLWAIAELAGQPPNFSTAITQITAPPSLSASPTELSFGSTALNTIAMAQSATFTNTGGSTITLGGVAKTGVNANDFSISADQCSGASLSPGQACIVSVAFRPTLQARETAILSLGYALGEAVVGLDGVGVNIAVLDITPNLLAFPATPQQTASAPLMLTLTNNGSTAGMITFLSLPGPFTETNNCPASIAPGASCQFFVTFRPTSNMTFDVFMDIFTNALNADNFIHVMGTGITAPAIVLCPASLVFGNQQQGTASASQPIVLTNTGSAATEITGIVANGDFTETDNCHGGVGPRESCTINVTFSPTAHGPRSGELVVSDNATGSPQSAPLAGTGATTTSLQQDLGATFTQTQANQKQSDAALRQRIVNAQRPLSFETNAGQFDRSVLYIAHSADFQVGIKQGGVSLQRMTRFAQEIQAGIPAPVRGSPVNIGFEGANRHAKSSGVERLPGNTNYFLGSDAGRWHTNVPNYARVQVQDVYPGIDLIYYGNQGRLEYDFVVAPEANPNMVRLHFDGTSSLRISPSGDLVVDTEVGALQIHRPVVYQVSSDEQSQGDSREYRSAGWVVKGKSSAAFTIGPYDHRKTLVIDPVLSFASYLGGSGGDTGKAITLDPAGNINIAGDTYSLDFPITPNAVVKSCGTAQFPCNSEEALESGFVAKFSADGSTLLYATYFGGTSNPTHINAIATDSTGNVYVTGATNAPDLPTTAGAFQPHCSTKVGPNACFTSFVTKFSPTGSSLVYSTYLGGTSPPNGNPSTPSDLAYALAVDSQGDAYIGGSAGSTDFPVTAGAYNTNPPAPASTHGFLTKLNSAGSGLIFSTFLGGSQSDAVTALAIDSSGNVTVAGDAQSLDFPTSAGAFQTGSYGGDVFVAKFSSSGPNLYSTLLGGGLSTNKIEAIAVDSTGSAYVTGQSISAGFPTTDNAFNTVKQFENSAFVSKIHPDGCALIYSTFLSARQGPTTDGHAIAVDAAGDAYIGGSVSQQTVNAPQANQFPLANPLQLPFGPQFSFVSELDPTGGKLLFSSPLDGSGPSANAANGIALDSSGNIYLTGFTGSRDFPLVKPFQTLCPACPPTIGLGGTAFVAKINVGQPSGVFLTRPSLTFGSELIDSTAAVPNTEAVSLMNNQASSLTIQSVNLSGSGYVLLPSFEPCSGTLAPGSGCVINVQFFPTDFGQGAGAITITDDGAGSPRVIPLDGVAQADFTISANLQQNVTVLKGAPSVNYFVSVGGVSGANSPTGSAQLSCTANSTVTCMFNPASISVGSTALLTLGNLAGVSGDTVSFSVAGTIGTQTATLPIQLQLADFTLAAAPNSATVAPGQSATYNLSVAGINTLTSSVVLACSNLPSGAGCSFSPTVVTTNGATPVASTLTITTGSQGQIVHWNPTPRSHTVHAATWLLSIAFFITMFFWITRRPALRVGRSLLALAIFLLFISVSCGGGGGGTSNSGSGGNGGSGGGFTTPQGTYTITVTGTESGMLQHSIQLTLTVN